MTNNTKQLRLERDSALQRLQDAEDKLERMSEVYALQLSSLRDERTALRKGMSTLTRRVEEVMNERDSLRTKLQVVTQMFMVWDRRECTAWDMAKQLSTQFR